MTNVIENRKPCLPESIEVIRKGDQVLIMNPKQPNWLRVTTNGAIALSYCDGESTVREIITEINRDLREDATEELLKLFRYGYEKRFFKDSKYELNSQDLNLNSVHINVTKKCNLRCIYCYTGAGEGFQNELAFKEWRVVLDDLFMINPNMQLVLTGGEPLLVDFLLDLAKYAKKLGFGLQLLTNGILFQDKMAKQYADLFDLIQINIDGASKEIHEFHRGSNTYEKTLSNIKYLANKGAKLQIATVVTQKNKDSLADIRKMFEGEMGIPVRFQPFYKMGRGSQKSNLELTGGEYYSALVKARDILPLRLFDAIPQRNRKTLSCGLGKNILSIDADGNVYPCHLLHINDMKLGNVREQKVMSIYDYSLAKYKSFSVNEITECKACPIRYICGGICRARAFFYTGKFYTKDPFCEYIKPAIFDALFTLCD